MKPDGSTPRSTPRTAEPMHLSPPAIRRQLLSEALQHPATLLPLAAAVLGLVYLLIVEPIAGGGPAATVAAGLGSAGAAASFLWRFGFRYAEEYARRANELLERQGRAQEALERAQRQQLREVIESGFATLGFTEGQSALNDLNEEFDQLRSALATGDDTDPLSFQHVTRLAEETHRRGLSVLEDALELRGWVGPAERTRLESEVTRLEREIARTKDDEAQAERTGIKLDTLSLHRQRLLLVDQTQLRLEHLLYQARRCEASLHRTRVEVAGARAGSSAHAVDAVVGALQRTIQQVKEVQEELRRMGL